MSTMEDDLNAKSTDRPHRIAIYPGSFDPVHYGHIDVACRAARLFDQVIVAIYDRPSKALLFTPEERIRLFQDSLAAEGARNVLVEGYSGLTVNYARERGAAAIVRGLRATSDFEYEYQMTTMNRRLEPELEAVFLMTSLQYAYLSSSILKEVAAGGASLDGLAPSFVTEAVIARLREQRR